MALTDPTLYLQTRQYSARQDRFLADRIFTEGVSDVAAGELLVTQRATGANLSVDVAPGVAVVAGDTVADQGKYIQRVVAGDVRNVVIPAPPASNSRIDLVVLQVHDSTADGGAAASDGAALEVVVGVAASVPTAPAVPASALVLAEVLVAAGVTSILNANITDRRVQLNAATLKIGTQFASMTTTQRDALAGADLFEGRTIWNTTTARLESYHAGAWMPSLRTYQTTTVTSTGTWTPPAGVSLVDVVVCGGGGSGTGGGTSSRGGGSGRVIKGQVAVTPGTPVAVVVGSGGAAASGGVGNAGSPSSFGAYTAPGGDGDGSGGSGGGAAGAPGGIFGTGPSAYYPGPSQVGYSPFPETPGGGGGVSGTKGGGAGSATAGGAAGASATGAGVSAAAGTGAGGGGGYNTTSGAGGSGFVKIGWWSA